jgi:hypothetical protein
MSAKEVSSGFVATTERSNFPDDSQKQKEHKVVSNAEGKRRSIHLPPASVVQVTATGDNRVAEQS